MPKFEESTGYKMKGSTFYGHGKSSPAKVSDDKVVEAQAKLNEIQDGWREPGWSKAARKVFSPMGAGSIGGGDGNSGGGDGNGGGKGKEKSTKVKTDHVINEAPEGTTSTESSLHAPDSEWKSYYPE